VTLRNHHQFKKKQLFDIIAPPNNTESISFKGGDFHTVAMYRALTRMFSLLETVMSNGVSLKSDIDRNLRHNLYTMFTCAFLGRRRLFQYLKKDEQQMNPSTELVFVVDGIYRRGSDREEPLLALVYLDARHSDQKNVQSRELFEREAKIQAKQIAAVRGSSHSTDNQSINILVNWNEAGLMRKLLQYNSKRMTHASKKHAFPSPWKASFLELLRADSRGLFPDYPIDADSTFLH
jgi:hypothetical protein